MLVKDGLTVDSATVITKLNFQSNNDEGGISIAVNGLGDQIQVTANPFWDYLVVIEVVGGTWRQQDPGIGGELPITVGQDYWLRVETFDAGGATGKTVVVSWSTDGVTFINKKQLTNLVNISGQVGYITWSFSPPAVNFDDLAVSTPCQFTYPVDPTTAAWRNDYDGHTPLDVIQHCYDLPYSTVYHAGQDYGFNSVLVDGAWTNTTQTSVVANGVVRYSSKPIGTGKNGKPDYGTNTTSYPGGVVIVEHIQPDGTPLYSQYGETIRSMYAHLDPDKILVAEGQRVVKGDTIATGLIPWFVKDKKTLTVSDNTHLHWEMRYFFDGSAILEAPQYKKPCATEPGPGYTFNPDDSLAHPDNFSGVVEKGKHGSLLYKIYHWTNPEDFVTAH